MELSELLPCIRCGSNKLQKYTKLTDCVKCENCGYYNTELNWNAGEDPKAWDNLQIRYVRSLQFHIKALESFVSNEAIEIARVAAKWHLEHIQWEQKDV